MGRTCGPFLFPSDALCIFEKNRLMIALPAIYITALNAAREAAEAIMQVYSGAFDPYFKNDGSPVTAADMMSSEIIVSGLSETGIPVTSEETEHKDFAVRKYWSECWCVDPLDGTKEFIKRNGEFTINIAHIVGQKPVFGLIASPVNDEVLFGGMGMGAYVANLSAWNDLDTWIPLSEPKKVNDPLVVASSRSHHSGPVLQYINDLRMKCGEIEYHKMGSALKFFALASGEADTYPRYAPTMEWDIAAGQAILEALGGSVVHADSGEPLLYNKENLKNPYFIASTKAFSEWSAN